MNHETLVKEIRGHCGTFGNKVGGAAGFEVLPEAANLIVPCAYVLPLDDNADDNQSENGYHQELHEAFGVVVVLDNTRDERGQKSMRQVHDVRAELWRALLGLVIGDYAPIAYQGGRLIKIDRKRLWYQFEFGADFTIDASDTRKGADLGALPSFEGVNLNLDAIDPMALPAPGPDGRIEHAVTIDVEQA